MSDALAPAKLGETCFLPNNLPGHDGAADSAPADRVAALVAAFNADVAFAEKSLAGRVRESACHLIPEGTPIPAEARATLDRYAVADALARHYRDRTNVVFKALLILGFLAMLVIEIFAHLAGHAPAGSGARLAVWLCPALWLIAFGLWYFAHRREYQKKYQDYRALAEGLRVQLFWTLLGMVDRVEDYYLRKQLGELEWIRRAVAWWRQRDEGVGQVAPPAPEEQEARKELALRHWLRGQLDYFAAAAPREERLAKQSRRWGGVLFWAGFAAAVAIGIVELWRGAHAPAPGLSEEQEALILATAVFLTGAAAAVTYGERMAFTEHARQFAAAGQLFRRHADQLRPGPLTPEDVELFRSLGREALQENGDWLLLHRDRPLEVVVP
jgi:hypothetical protein